MANVSASPAMALSKPAFDIFRLPKPMYELLEYDGHNYTQWKESTERVLRTRGLTRVLQTNFNLNDPNNVTLDQEILLFLQLHFAKPVQARFQFETTSKSLWTALTTRYEEIAQELRQDVEQAWVKLHFGNYKTIDSWAEAIFNLKRRMQSCNIQYLVTTRQ
ncbi:hypothetical protein DFS34DRAFT_590393 [Phlyctochytrium arcticum]|nr:hypothetical protein DFS34DRAFT_598478 [Phlyctochytrium arcticum]KAI9088824.1 hypothetical protein DFS34DRAFT_598188 [Phlyctochytrium arcticum]KAI9103985.1 hypothetical protein DFS34DRAFT_590393 [Phlyctochytrium arcticum]